ncbi:MAG: AraC family transcriptional regulator [Pyrinomonadaceae bacterium]|nr:AraC family transcriptional regulator [Pyrinomonadaceae bacterium]
MKTAATTQHQIIASDKFSASLSDYQTELRQNWHSHDEFILAMVLRGNVREQVRCEDTLINAFDVGIKSPEVRHTDHFCPDGVRVIRLSLTPQFITELKNQSLINEGWYWLKGSDSVRHFLQIGQSLLSKNDEIENDVHELLAALLPKKDLPKSHPPFWLRRAKERIEATYSDGIRLNQLAVEAGVHPVYFARKFQHFYGSSVGNYIRKMQFQKVQSLLISGKYNLAQIAVEAGFSDQAHLTRTLGNDFGITPAKLRKLLQ